MAFSGFLGPELPLPHSLRSVTGHRLEQGNLKKGTLRAVETQIWTMEPVVCLGRPTRGIGSRLVHLAPLQLHRTQRSFYASLLAISLGSLSTS